MALTQWREIRGRMSVAMEVGVEAAILLEDIYYWVNHNRERQHNFNEGYYWTVNSYQDFVNRFPCFSVGKIKRLLAQLKTAGFIEARHYRNYDPRNRSLWYRTTQKTAEHYTSLAEAANQRNGDEFDTFQGHKSDLTCASVKSDQCMSQNRPMHRTELHFPEELAPHDTNKQVEIVKNSIINGWGSFYQLSVPKVTKQPGYTNKLRASPRDLYEETMAKVEKLESNNRGDNDDVLF